MAAQVALRRHQASELTSVLKAKVKSAASLLQQRKVLQRNLRSLQQHSLSREILTHCRSRLHALPPTDAVKSMSPLVNERMRKRRCFADKELEVVMLEREQQAELTHRQLALHYLQRRLVYGTAVQLHQPPPELLDHRLHDRSMSREFLMKVFPHHNPNLVELVFQGCGGNLERTIEQLASEFKCNGGAINSVSPVVGEYEKGRSQQTPTPSSGLQSFHAPCGSASIHKPSSGGHRMVNVFPFALPQPMMVPGFTAPFYTSQMLQFNNGLETEKKTENVVHQSSTAAGPSDGHQRNKITNTSTRSLSTDKITENAQDSMSRGNSDEYSSNVHALDQTRLSHMNSGSDKQSCFVSLIPNSVCQSLEGCERQFPLPANTRNSDLEMSIRSNPSAYHDLDIGECSEEDRPSFIPEAVSHDNPTSHQPKNVIFSSAERGRNSSVVEKQTPVITPNVLKFSVESIIGKS
ncbi:uncharacterized protein LOC101850961 [Aplysia californica]|uniref:Uncharacterized protein LOC101850961 n=1 Tax=Aplysia californica TaxID=6500 RepID=A0ABM1A1U1_APLCA|nr:uncharacterized protein LOC101850961 [Aplysia californica]